MISRPDLYQDEKLLSYSKYYYIDPDPLHPLAAQILRKPLEKEDVLWPEDVEKMFSPGYQDAMLGYYLFDGGSYSALYAQLNGVTIDMLDWWFVWMTIPPKSVAREHGNLRYKIWCPMDHFDHYPSDEATEKQLTDDTVPLKLRRQGIHVTAVESFDLGKSREYKKIPLYPTPNSALSLPQELWDYINACGLLNVQASDHSVTLQFFRKTSYGCEAIFRTWRGYTLNSEGKIVRKEGYPTPTKEHVLQDLMHNLHEIPHFAKFLPQLYAEEGNKPVDVY
jgi:hypothetical protein